MIANCNILNNKKKILPFLFKYYLYSHFPDEKEPFFSHYPIILGYKNHILPQ